MAYRETMLTEMNFANLHWRLRHGREWMLADLLMIRGSKTGSMTRSCLNVPFWYLNASYLQMTPQQESLLARLFRLLPKGSN